MKLDEVDLLVEASEEVISVDARGSFLVHIDRARQVLHHPKQPTRSPIPPAYTVPAAVLPLKLTEVIQPLRFEVKGQVTAASDGRVAFAEVSGGSSLPFPNHPAVLLTADTIHPVATPADVLLIRQHHEARDGDLVIAAVGE